MAGRRFWKMSGSGNDFVFFDAREDPVGALADSAAIRALCARRTGVGADGVVFIEPWAEGDFRMRYFNSDGSLASMCGNAALCSARLAVDLGAASEVGFRFGSDAGVITGRILEGLPEIDLAPVEEVTGALPLSLDPGEQRIGFARVGVPHAVVLCDDADAVPLTRRGGEIRNDPSFREGANVDFVSPAQSGWRMRTFERGVEGETLACGTGAVASAIVLAVWGLATEPLVSIATSSGLPLEVRPGRGEHSWRPTLRGSAIVTFRGELGEVQPDRPPIRP
jgi:diaminopimelate epimerase